jgi:hypothetical protein
MLVVYFPPKSRTARTDMILRPRILCLWKFALLLVAAPTGAATRELGPSDPWCQAINRAAPGDEIILVAGFYSIACSIKVKGAPGSPIVVRSASADPSMRAALAYSGTTSNVLELRGAQHIALRWLSFGPTQGGVDAIKLRRSSDVLVEQNLFYGIGGISISANDGDSNRITVRKNVFQNLTSTALYFGCHEGESCHATDLTIEGNFIDRVTPLDQNSVGYGLQIKLNSYGIVRDNTVYRTRGPGIMVYGSNRGDPPSIVEGNYVEGSLTDGGIVIGGGAAIVLNNVVVGNAAGGIIAQNYGGRDLQQNVWVVHNTVLENGGAGIIVQAWRERRGNVLSFNAIAPRAATMALLPVVPSGTIRGNITCEAIPSCFARATGPPYDLRPAPSGDVAARLGGGPEEWRPVDDFLGRSRGRSTSVGAFERTSLAEPVTVGGGQPRPRRTATAVTNERGKGSGKQ